MCSSDLDDLERMATETAITPALLSQATVFEFIERGAFEPHLERLRAGLRERRDAMSEALSRHIPGARWSSPAHRRASAGMRPSISPRSTAAKACAEPL